MTEPILGVHLLTEFVFCPRAGLCTRDTASADEPESPANLNFLPDLDEQEMREAARQRCLRAFYFAAGSVGLSALALALQTDRAVAAWSLAAAAAFCFGGCLHALLDCAVLGLRLRAARRAVPGEPDLGGAGEQAVDWWSLRRAGYEPVRYGDALFDPALGLAGRPWRVLRRGGLRIPVFRRDDDGPVRPQHRVRLAADCRLLESCEGGESPFGVLLNRGTRRGVAVLAPPAGAAAVFGGAVERARAVIRDAAAGKKPPKPNPALCRGCPHGKPCRVSPDGDQPFASGGIPLPVVAARGLDGHLYHSHCGDRFGETPPHERAVRLGLRR